MHAYMAFFVHILMTITILSFEVHKHTALSISSILHILEVLNTLVTFTLDRLLVLVT